MLRGGAETSGAAVLVLAVVSSEVVDLSGIALEVAASLRQGVTTKFLQKSIGEDKSNHSFTGDRPGGEDAQVGTLVSGLDGLLGDHVGGAEGAAEGGDRLQVAANNDVFAVGDAAFQAAGSVGGGGNFAGVFVLENFVLYSAAEGAGSEYACADFDAFDSLNAHYGLR